MLKRASTGLLTACIAAAPLSPVFAQHCSPDWTAAYRCMNGCGGCPAARAPRGGSAPYIPPPPTPEQIAAQKAHALDEEGVDAFNAGDFAKAESLFSEAAEATPNDAVIANNLAQARDRLKMKQESNARREAIMQHLDHLSSDLSASRTTPAAPGPNFSGAPAANDLGFMDPVAESQNANLDTAGVDGRKMPSGLPRFVDEAITSGYSGAPPGVSDRVRKGFQAVAAHDWKAARAWFQDALNHDPNNAGLKRLSELADFTLTRTQAGAAKISSASSAVQLPELTDIQFLFPGGQIAQPGATLDLPKESDIVYLFPGLPDLEAKELADYTDKYWISRIETEPQMAHSDRRSPRKSSVHRVTK